MTPQPDCRFCLDNQLLADKPLLSNAAFYFLSSIDPDVRLAGMIIPTATVKRRSR